MVDAPDVASTPNMLTRSPAEFAALPELAATFIEPQGGGLVPKFATLPQRWHSSLIGTFLQRCIKEVQAFMAASTPATSATVSTTDATPTEILSVAIADGEHVEIDAKIVGKRTNGTVAFVFGRYTIHAIRVDTASGIEIDVIEDTLPTYKPAAGGLSTADASIVPNGASALQALVTGELATNINWEISYAVRRFS